MNSHEILEANGEFETLKEIRREGYWAYLDGKSRYDNPYTEDWYYDAWQEGFDDAAWDD